jgi:N,N'-diacetylchitobiose transport system substrate-binding protein
VGKTIAVAAALALTMLGVAACGEKKDEAAANEPDGKGKTLKIWLMVDAQTAWPNVVEATTSAFTEKTGADVKVEYQQWSNHLTKLDATLAGADVPDVIELGNTEAPKYVFNGAFADISARKSTFDNNGTWLTGLSAPCEADGKLYCAPYYAGARVLHYRTDLFQTAGLQPPTTYDELLKVSETLQAKNGANPKFSPIHAPGKYWYAAMSFVYGSGGQIAKKDGGKWKGTLSESQAVEGLQKWTDLQKKYSKADPTKDESDQAAVFSQGQTAMMIGAGWEGAAAESQPSNPNDPKSAKADTVVKGKIAAIPVPGYTADKPMPAFLGGSVVGVTAKSANKALATEWTRIFTGTASQELLVAKGALPNTTSLLDKAAAHNGNEATAVAAKVSWFTPTAEKWADVEKGNVMQQMLVDIATGKKSIADATKAADDEITKTLNG